GAVGKGGAIVVEGHRTRRRARARRDGGDGRRERHRLTGDTGVGTGGERGRRARLVDGQGEALGRVGRDTIGRGEGQGIGAAGARLGCARQRCGAVGVGGEGHPRGERTGHAQGGRGRAGCGDGERAGLADGEGGAVGTGDGGGGYRGEHQVVPGAPLVADEELVRSVVIGKRDNATVREVGEVADDGTPRVTDKSDLLPERRRRVQRQVQRQPGSGETVGRQQGAHIRHTRAQAAGARGERDGAAVAVQGNTGAGIQHDLAGAGGGLHDVRGSARRGGHCGIRKRDVAGLGWIAYGDGARGRGDDPGELGAGEVDAVHRGVVAAPQAHGPAGQRRLN